MTKYSLWEWTDPLSEGIKWNPILSVLITKTSPECENLFIDTETYIWLLYNLVQYIM